MPIDFPNSPNNGDSFTSNDKTWQYNGTSWVVIAGSVSIDAGSVTASKLANNAVTSDKIAAGAVTAAKLGNDISLTPADGSITQAKLAASLSGVTVTTTANRNTAVPSPFTGQLVFLTDVTRLQVWNGSAWTFITNGAPGAPTALSATALSTTSVSVSFTPGESAGASPINYKYSLSTNGGSTYSEPTALDPADTTSPVTISGLTGGQTYHIKLRAVSDFGDSPDSTATSITLPSLPSAPTSLSATASGSSVSISFTPGADGGSAVINYQYALSTDSGSTYSAFTALNPADATSPITITGLTEATAYSAKLKAVSAFGAGAESAAVSFTSGFTVQYLVVAGGGGGGRQVGGGGGAGGYLTGSSFVSLSTNYSATVGSGGGAADSSDGQRGKNGSNSVFSTITSIGGGGGGGYSANNGRDGGSGGGADGGGPTLIGFGTVGQGNNGGQGVNGSWAGGGGGGAGSVGVNATPSIGGNGGVGQASSITGSSIYYAGGGGGCSDGNATGSSGGLGGGGAGRSNSANGDQNGVANRGGGGGGIRDTGTAGAGGSGVVILRYSATRTITLGAGLTGTTSASNSDKVTTITAGSGNVSWS